MEAGRVRNPSFTDYLIPTILDMPADARGRPRAGRPQRALRAAGRGRGAHHFLDPGHRGRRPGCHWPALTRVPVRPEDITGRAYRDLPRAWVAHVHAEGVSHETVLDDITRWLGRTCGPGPGGRGRGLGDKGSGGGNRGDRHDEVAGSASGGCVEGALVEEARAGPGRRREAPSTDLRVLRRRGLRRWPHLRRPVRVLIERLDPPAPASGAPTSWVDELTEVLQLGHGCRPGRDRRRP